MKRILHLFLLLTIIASSATADTGKTIKLVSSLPRTGSANAQTTSMVNGIKMAIEEVGSKVGDYTIVFEDWDDASPERGQWDPAVEAANAEKAIADPDVMAYIGTYNSGAAKISMPKLNQAGLAMVSPANSWPGLTKPGFGEAGEPQVYRPSNKITYFRVAATDDLQGPAAARWAKEMGVKKIFVLNDRELYGKGIADLVQKTAPMIGIEVVGNEGIDPKASNYRSLATKIRQTNPDLVYFGGTTQTNAGQIIKDLRSSGVKAKYMVPDGCMENAFIQAAGPENVEGTTFITFGGVPAEKLQGKGKQFFDNYLSKYGIAPESYAAYSYEATAVVLDAIKRAGKKDRQAIVDALTATKNFAGLLGTWSFNPTGDISSQTISGNIVKNGKFEFVKMIS
jgi:branched-chain amino acid transport system substrate-binding protein